jgi:hypothetical protein
VVLFHSPSAIADPPPFTAAPPGKSPAGACLRYPPARAIFPKEMC